MTQQEKSQLKSLLQDPRWKVIENVAAEICAQINQQEIVARDTEWDSLKSLLQGTGQKQGIKRLLDTLWNQVQ